MSEYGVTSHPHKLARDVWVGCHTIFSSLNRQEVFKAVLLKYYQELFKAVLLRMDSLIRAIDSSDVEKCKNCVIEEGKINDQTILSWGATVLHYACEKGCVDIVRVLVTKFNADLNIRKKSDKSTPLHCACLNGHSEVVRVLLAEFKADLTAQDSHGHTPLHSTCSNGHIGVVRVLVSEFRADLSIQDTAGLTPLMLAARGGHEDVVLALLRDYQCPVTDRDNDGWGVLHHSLVKALAHDETLEIAHNLYRLAFFLISEFNCDPNVKDIHGRTPLSYACERGDIYLVHKLICDHKADVNHLDKEMNTPLQVAVNHGNFDVACRLIFDSGCNANVADKTGRTPLHYACEKGDTATVQALIQEHNADVNVRNKKMNMPLHIAAAAGRYELVLALIKDTGCDPSAKGHLGRTPLHLASQIRHHKIVQELLKFTSPLVTDKDGNTPLHLAVKNMSLYKHLNAEVIRLFVEAKAPLLIRNNKGQTPIDLARSTHVQELFQTYAKENILANYDKLSKHARKKYSGSHCITRVFVLGYPGAGKSSFIESLKREGLFQSFSKVSESSVPPHTAGIIPSVHMSKQYGRVLFYDFAGDAEYYSSHAAIFESLASSRKGNNIFIVVVDLRDDDCTLENTLHYWFSFIQYQKFHKASFLVVGSHLDQSVELSACLSQFCAKMQHKVQNIEHFMLDCRDPRSNPIALFKKQVNTWVSQSQKYNISNEAGLLLGLLEKDFSAVTACPVQTIISHIKDSGVCLPVDPKRLHQILLELHEVGILLLLGDCTKDSYHVILNISKLTNEVHELLFASSALSKAAATSKVASLKIGILPESFLSELLPPYITIECLIHLQYCQKIDMSLFPSLKQNDSTSQPFLFFPALCSVDKSQVSWDDSTGNSFSIGWLALCNDSHDYFPPRFLHVLLLRLVYGFTLSSARQKTPHASPEHSRRCTMWKNGVHWRMEEGVDCMVELVNGCKGVVFLIKSSMDGAEDCTRIFTKVASCVMEAKAEFCHSAKPEFFLLDSSAEADYLNEDHQFAVNDVERALESPEGKRVIISVSGRGKMELSKLQCMRNLTHWDSLFPVNFTTIINVLKEIVRELYEFGQSLGVPRHILQAIEADFPNDVSRRRRELVRWWMSSSQDRPCWWHLVQALRRIDENVLAERIREDHDCHIQLQSKLLCEETRALKPDEEFLHSLSGVVGSRWSSLAVSLALTEEEIEELKGKVGHSKQELALQMLKIWASREEATYGCLHRQLKKISLFQY